jgi:hypothetical protein
MGIAQAILKDPRVDMVYKDQDGWWMELKTGWAFDPADPPYGGCHTISEDTLRELKSHLDLVYPCACACCIK